MMKRLNVLLYCSLYLCVVLLIQSCSSPEETAMKTTDYWKGRKAIEKLSDQRQLERIATEALNADVRSYAVGKLTDQTLLTRMAHEDASAEVRGCAVSRLTDRALLAAFALEDSVASVRGTAAFKLSDPVICAKMALNDESEALRSNALDMLLDSAMTVELAGVDGDDDAALMSEFIRAFESVPVDKRGAGRPPAYFAETVISCGCCIA